MHNVCFKNRKNDWSNALPLGNGCFGAMAFYDGAYTLAMNHYEVYYNISPTVLPSEQLKNLKTPEVLGAAYENTRKRADLNQPSEGEPFYYYRLSKAQGPSYAAAEYSNSYPATGELRFGFDDNVIKGDSELRLDVERAAVTLDLDKRLSLETVVLRSDCIVTKVCQKAPDLVKTISILYPDCRGREYPLVDVMQVSPSVFAYKVKIQLSEDTPFYFAGVIRLIGATGRLEKNVINVIADGDFSVLTGIYTDWKYEDPLQGGLAEIEREVEKLDASYKEHINYWTEFFSRSRICLPDKFLENVYYINQYALDCSSGRDGVMKHHACGLNGLWAVRHPNLWGSRWYWDVNIQAAFAGVFSSNRTELGKVFSDGLLSYVDLAERYARNSHNLDGVAMDYPHMAYYCMWPWCAQYLWSQYEYTKDLDYLRDEAYPLFKKLCKFALGVFEFDEQRGCYVVYPDISPEQGPLAHNTVITVSSVKYMLKFTLESAELLGDKDELLSDIRRLYDGLPEYPTGTDNFGRHFLDSEDAPVNLWIRHPSMLMPIFPTGEINIDSDPRTIETALNTIKYLSENCEIGVFQVSWLAAAAARLGKGQMALRLLYEMGLDHLIRSNGLAAEENERFMNVCLIMRQPFYYPCMMEFTGEMLAAVNEMLMQSDGGVIRLFPAMPDGDKEYDRLIRRGVSLDEYDCRYSEYPAWKDVRFERLLARGAFEVSAELKESAVAWVKITSRVGGRVKITSPYSLDNLKVFVNGQAVEYSIEGNYIEFDTTSGGTYTLLSSADCIIPDAVEPEGNGVMTHLSYTKRHIYIGEDSETEYHRAIDAFVRDWYLGNVRMENHTVYKFDFGGTSTKNYAKEFPSPCFAAERLLMIQMACVRLKELSYSVYQGYGFTSAEGISCQDRGTPDELRRDFVEGTEDTEFLIEATRGQYELLAVCGDSEEESVTILEAVGGRRCGGKVVPAGQYQCSLLPLVQEEDGCIRLKVSTTPGHKWKLNLLFMNMVKRM